MKRLSLALRLLLLPLTALAVSCSSTAPKTAAPTVAAMNAGKQAKADATKKPAKDAKPAADDLDEYAVVDIADPLEGLNRGTFWVNDKLYLVLFRPISKGYEKIMPRPVRKGVDNAFENVKFPVRFVNSALQGKFKRAGRETEKFLVNTIAGIGGLFRVSDEIDSLANIPEEDTGKTFASWGMGHGAYIVIPFLGPSSVRDGVGLVGDYALNPVNWGVFWKGKHDWTMIPPTANTLRALPTQLSVYDSAKKDAVDPYIALRSAYVQYRAEALKKSAE